MLAGVPWLSPAPARNERVRGSHVVGAHEPQDSSFEQTVHLILFLRLKQKNARLRSGFGFLKCLKNQSSRLKIESESTKMC